MCSRCLLIPLGLVGKLSWLIHKTANASSTQIWASFAAHEAFSKSHQRRPTNKYCPSTANSHSLPSIFPSDRRPSLGSLLLLRMETLQLQLFAPQVNIPLACPAAVSLQHTQPLIRQQDSSIELIRKTSMPATNHHGADNELAEWCELAAERGHDGWMAET